MENNSKIDKLRRFCEFTGVETDEAEKHLEVAHWNYNLAMRNYLEDQSDGNSDDEEVPQAKSTEPSKYFPGMISSVATIKNDASDEYYVGGSVSSGQTVIDNGKKRRDMKSHAENLNILEETKVKTHFSGVGRVLDSGAPEDVTEKRSATNAINTGNITFWHNGFVVDDGPLRDYDAQENVEFLNALQHNEIPSELSAASPEATTVKLAVTERFNECFKAPRKIKPFSGSGQKLGDTATAICSPIPPVKKESEDGDKVLELDESSPLTRLKIRLLDGSELVVKVNHSHKVSDVRQHIIAIRPDYASVPFALMTSYPRTEIEDLHASVKDANLLNANIVLVKALSECLNDSET